MTTEPITGHETQGTQGIGTYYKRQRNLTQDLRNLLQGHERLVYETTRDSGMQGRETYYRDGGAITGGPITHRRGRGSQGEAGTQVGVGKARLRRPRGQCGTPPGARRTSPPRRGHDRRMWGSRRRRGCSRAGRRGHSS